MRRVRDAFLDADYSVAGVDALLGPVATRALSRGETVPARRATAGGSPLETLVRLFLLQITVPVGAVQAALPPDAGELGLVAIGADGVSACLDVRPYAENGEDGPYGENGENGPYGETRERPDRRVRGRRTCQHLARLVGGL